MPMYSIRSPPPRRIAVDRREPHAVDPAAVQALDPEHAVGGSRRCRRPTGMRPSSDMSQPATVSNRPSSGTLTPVRSSSSSGRRMPGKVNQSRERTTSARRAVVLVGAPRRPAPRPGPRGWRRPRCRRTRRPPRPSGSRGCAARRAAHPASSSRAPAARRSASAATGTSPRLSAGHRDRLLHVRRCRPPRRSLSSTTGKRECPVRRASSMTASAGSSRSTWARRGRGVMTSCAVSDR